MGACENFEDFLKFLANNWQSVRCMIGAGSDHNISNSTDLNLIEELGQVTYKALFIIESLNSVGCDFSACKITVNCAEYTDNLKI